ncbi:carbon-nitrogen hydrolase family protein [Actinomadura parmotrematis]|uniref:Carbon-nitrogen hydrolase family protein n=1 Tax=Actinomadura parmotrematis TaxID=2864039 RepID=A0ABS7FZ17_9ACTN|nr:carbon-nitrogen hydrolase family protein [Actinomadura parmotrematis]MBW8485395.1 carbon-nitrogen hydrolase family protein [Actinomadura parmotrematis]
MTYEILNVALAQTASVPHDVRANAAAAAGLVRRAADAGAELLVLPELFLTGYDLTFVDDPAAYVTEDDPRLDGVRAAARDAGVTTVLGAALRRPGGAAWIASLVLLPDGGTHPHGKCHLHGPERDAFEPAGEGRVLDVAGWKVGLAVCYDAGVPAHAAGAAARGAEVYAGSALYTQAETRRLDLHFAARAMDHRMYAVVANHAGGGAGWVSCGGSGAWHPDGTRLVQAATGEGIVTAALARAEMAELRDRDAAAGYPRGAAPPR